MIPESENYSINIDDERKLIRVQVGGFWSVDFANRYVAEFSAVLVDCRRRYGRVRVYNDTGCSPAQSQDVGRILSSLDRAYLEGDRMAMLVGSSLVKMQINRIATFPGLKAFTSSEDALAWAIG